MSVCLALTKVKNAQEGGEVEVTGDREAMSRSATATTSPGTRGRKGCEPKGAAEGRMKEEHGKRAEQSYKRDKEDMEKWGEVRPPQIRGDTTTNKGFNNKEVRPPQIRGGTTTSNRGRYDHHKWGEGVRPPEMGLGRPS